MRKVIILTLLILTVFASAIHAEDNSTLTEISSFDFVRLMKIGWNLGNSLDSTDFRKQGIKTAVADITPEELYETMWGNPVTSEETIRTVAEAGFGAVRIPVTYFDHMDENFIISETWLKRVQEIVDYALDNDMYCIINLHHDAGNGTWVKADLGQIDEIKKNLETVWQQIAKWFVSYDSRLVFESFNEILDADSTWTKAGKKAYTAVNILNQTFVDTVRSTGGENAHRFLILKTYAAGIDKDMFEAFVIPEDSAEDKLIVGVHMYVPTPFSYLKFDYDPANAGNESKTFYTILADLKTFFIDKGIPAVITEFGARNKNNSYERKEYAREFTSETKKLGIVCFWWDDGGKTKDVKEVTNFALLDRNTNKWIFPEIVETLVRTANLSADETDLNETPSKSYVNVTPQNDSRSGLYLAIGAVLLLVVNFSISAVIFIRKKFQDRK